MLYGGKIACYINDSFSPLVLTESDIPSLQGCNSEILPNIMPKLVLITLYHPFLNCPNEHLDHAVIINIIHFGYNWLHPVFRLDSSDLPIVIIGDINDLHNYTNDIEHLIGTEVIIDFSTKR